MAATSRNSDSWLKSMRLALLGEDGARRRRPRAAAGRRGRRPRGRSRGATAGRSDPRRQAWRPRRPPADVTERAEASRAPRRPTGGRAGPPYHGAPWTGSSPASRRPGNFTLGNYLGALRHWVSFQDGHDAFYCVVDLHALTIEIDPADLRANTLDAALNLLAVGPRPRPVHALRPEPRARAHPADLAARVHRDHGRAAAHDPVQGQGQGPGGRSGSGSSPTRSSWRPTSSSTTPTAVPVGDDQRQHLELARELAVRFNNRYGDDLRRPRGRHPRDRGPGHGPPAPRAQDVQVGRVPARARSACSTRTRTSRARCAGR